ncbi:alpha-xenorhabdolysin family binary toxin subunit A [Brevibacillus laterosporus]|uniref:alpha-xenorhabdolysin family binary toxin subunit A n=1 Tax=Brevibacillus laterosporus TaxID=1465 RepID=UPI0035A612BE
MNNNAITIDLSPRELAEESTFLIEKEEWVKVQRYVIEGKFLPTNKEEMCKRFSLNKSLDFTDVEPVFPVYKNIKLHCEDWSKNTFPQAIKVADDIIDYADKADVYYKPLNDLVEQIQKTNDEDSMRKFKRICEKLMKEASVRSQNAKNVADNMQKFYDETLSDNKDLQPLVKKQQDRFKELGENVNQIKKKIDDLQRDLDKELEKKAELDKYKWLGFIGGWLFGLITKESLDGTLGKDYKIRIEGLIKEKNELTDQHQKALVMMKLLELVKGNTENLLDKMKRAISVLQKITNIWSAIAEDLGRLLKVVEKEIPNDIELADLAIEEAIKKWRRVGKNADDFRINAVIDFK